MRDDYKLKGPLTHLEVEIEKSVAETLLSMEKHSKISLGELANTAIKRFISSHKDFLPPRDKQTK